MAANQIIKKRIIKKVLTHVKMFFTNNFITVIAIREKKAMSQLQGRKEVFYLMTHSTHYIYGYMASAYGKGKERKCFI